jgi:hypothetical protein
MREDFGAIVNARNLVPTIQRLLNDETLPEKGANARLFALKNRFADQAANLAKLLS